MAKLVKKFLSCFVVLDPGIIDHQACRSCSYSLKGLEGSGAGRCPECGAEIPADADMSLSAPETRCLRPARWVTVLSMMQLGFLLCAIALPVPMERLFL